MTATAHPRSDANEANRWLALHAALDEPADAVTAWDKLRVFINLDDCWDPDIITLLPLVWRNLSAGGCPHQDLARLRGVHHNLWVQARHTQRAVEALVDALEDAGIPATVSGGVALSRRWYASLGDRHSADTAVVVPPRQLAAATEVACTLGWVHEHRQVPHRLWWLAAARVGAPWRHAAGARAPRKLVQHRQGPTVSVTVCVTPSPWCPTGAPAAPAPPGTPDVPDAETALLGVLCGGATAITPQGLQWVADAVHILRSGDVDGDRFAATVQAWGVGALVGRRLQRVVTTFAGDRAFTMPNHPVTAARSTLRARVAARRQQVHHD